MNRDLGRFGEAWTAGYLTRLGYEIVDRNVRFPVGEIDLVAQDGEELVFVEVKCRRTRRFGAPEASITRRRFEHIASAVETYLARAGICPPSYRVDVVALEVDAAGRVAAHLHLKAVEAPPS